MIERNIYLTKIQINYIETWLNSISALSGLIVFIILFLFLLGQRLSYLKEIIKGIDALQNNNMDYIIPLEGNNELTELALNINNLAKTEMKLKQKETALANERENLIRSLSHDIRTPLTAILSYCEYMESKENLSKEELREYFSIIRSKSEQIKFLTDRLLNNGTNKTEIIHDGKLLMEQLAYEWAEILEDNFNCIINLDRCKKFTGEFDITQLRRIFDNLASNIEKYADNKEDITLDISTKNGVLLIYQSNAVKTITDTTESHKIGLENINTIVKQYGGKTEVFNDEKTFSIKITIADINL